MHRFLPAIASEQGVTIAEVVVNHARGGTADRNTASLTVRVILDLLTVKSAELFDAATSDLRPIGLVMACRHRHHRMARIRAADRTGVDCQPAVAAVRHSAGLHRCNLSRWAFC